MKSEGTGERHSVLSSWMRKNLPQQQFAITDVDFFLYNFSTRSGCLIEEKLKGRVMDTGQAALLTILNRALAADAAANGWNYKGLNLIRFDQFDFDSPVRVDNLTTDVHRVVDEQELIKMLTMED